MLFHDECIDKNDNICYGCLGITKQRTVIDNPAQDSPSTNVQDLIRQNEPINVEWKYELKVPFCNQLNKTAACIYFFFII